MSKEGTSADAASPSEPGRELAKTDQAGLRPVSSSGGTAPNEPLRLIDRFLLANLHSRKELEAVQVVLDARIEQLRHQAAAASRESKTYWDARSAEVVAAMKTYVQARLRAIENERMASRLDSLERAYEMFASKVREVETGTLPEEIRGELIRKMRQNLDETIDRLERDAIAEKYDLRD
jgi:hypothetical protein